MIEIFLISKADEETWYYTNHGVVMNPELDEVECMVKTAKAQICKRPNVLDRWEPWEIPDQDPRKVATLIMGRAKDRTEKQLVQRYMAAIGRS